MNYVRMRVSTHPWRCIDTDGTRCQWLRTRQIGTIRTCLLFAGYDRKGRLIALEERDGCVVRHEDCLAAERGR